WPRGCKAGLDLLTSVCMSRCGVLCSSGVWIFCQGDLVRFAVPRDGELAGVGGPENIGRRPRWADHLRSSCPLGPASQCPNPLPSCAVTSISPFLLSFFVEYRVLVEMGFHHAGVQCFTSPFHFVSAYAKSNTSTPCGSLFSVAGTIVITINVSRLNFKAETGGSRGLCLIYLFLRWSLALVAQVIREISLELRLEAGLELLTSAQSPLSKGEHWEWLMPVMKLRIHVQLYFSGSGLQAFATAPGKNLSLTARESLTYSRGRVQLVSLYHVTGLSLLFFLWEWSQGLARPLPKQSGLGDRAFSLLS
uniref:Transmembrane protein 161A n=1 Tax=Macaca mulatta TaxID=9544 RepID=A0A5F7ZGS8_MACMU